MNKIITVGETAAPILTDSVVTRLAQIYWLAAFALKNLNKPAKEPTLQLLRKYTNETLGKFQKELNRFGFLRHSWMLSDFIGPNAIRSCQKASNNISEIRYLIKALKEDRAINIDELNVLNSSALFLQSYDDDARMTRASTNVKKTSRQFLSDLGKLTGTNSVVKDTEEARVSSILKTLEDYVRQVKPRATKTYKLTVDEQKKLSEIARTGYRKTMAKLKDLYTSQLTEFIVSNNDKPVFISEAFKYLDNLGHELHWIPDLPKSIPLRVSVKAGKVTYYTEDFYELTGGIAPGSTGVKLTSNYNPKTKTGAYIQFKAPNAATITRLYTIAHKDTAQDSKFVKADAVIAGMDKYVRRWVKDMANRNEDPTTRMVSSVCYMVYLTGMRIGTRIKTAASITGKMTYGAMSLRFEHIRVNEKSITLEYTGKKNVPQKHIILIKTPAEKLLAKNLKEFLKGKKKGSIAFAWEYHTGREKTLNSAVLGAYLKSCGFPAGIHKIRHARGTQIVQDILEKIKWKASISANTTVRKQKEAEDWFKKKVLEPVAALLGHKSGGEKLLWQTSIKNYCNPAPVIKWFQDQQLRIPKWVPLKEEKEEASFPLK